ncbi:M15 family metallopeptidase [Aminipila butyrica]|uniref:M15 family metallopeptidase n=1 Tax=Aminipila butyrica TaxID=433296 RepID=A0A858BTD0_9FIRM|nr:M15 family metallopeptidase [Aminipila butyrica]QIB69261.1 M15 family metallopeptidase [Aminipila butyrica]
MNKILLSTEQIYRGNLLLVNKDFPVKTSGEGGFVPVDSRFPEILIKSQAAKAFRWILEEIGGSNEIIPVSGYRPSAEQEKIYESSMEEYGELFTRKFVAKPYHSEHQTGLAIDLGEKKEHIDFICPDFPYRGICQQFRRRAAHYGFIQRYSEEKEAITGIAHEPWHFRYVGYPHSQIISKKGLAFEEYIAFLKRFSAHKKYVFQRKGQLPIHVFYVPADASGITAVSLPEQGVHEISGNNSDGFIVTHWPDGTIDFRR